MKRAIFLMLVAAWATLSCTAHNISNVKPGMSKHEVEQMLGSPDGYASKGEYEAYIYQDRLVSGWSWDRADYSCIFQDDKLVEYGHGEVREEDDGRSNILFLYRMH